ncbi:MAG TPA: AraC family transcriptional regulator [Burkholderiaceae bacterium]
MSMSLVLRELFGSELLTIRHAVARPSLSRGDDVPRGTADLMLLPISGVFAKHESPKRHGHIIANSNHALFFGHGKDYRISFPGHIGDESLVFAFSQSALAELLAQTVGAEQLYSDHLNTHSLLAPCTILQRELLWRHLKSGVFDRLAIEELSIAMLTTSLLAACKDSRSADRARHSFTLARRRQQVELVKELISLHPEQDWALGDLAREAAVSPYHLVRVFREEVGVPVHHYLVRTRLGRGLEGMRSPDAGLTDIALEAGFANHSHFTSHFRTTFGTTPSQFRKAMPA